MPQCCAVPKCSNKKGGHKFPRDKKRLKQWIAAIRRDFLPTKNSLVCKDHFSKDDYELPKDSVYDNPRLQLKKTAIPSRFPWSKESNDFLQKRKEPTEHGQKYSLQKKILPQDKSSSSNSKMTFRTSPPFVNTDSINKNPKEKSMVPFDHKHVLKLLHDKQYFCSVCHKRFTRLGPQALRNKHTNKQTTLKTEATPLPVASDSTVPFIKQEKEYIQDEMVNKDDCDNEISTKTDHKYTSNVTEGPSAVELSVANNNSLYVTVPPELIQKQEIKVECIEVEVQTKGECENRTTERIINNRDDTSTELKNVPKKPRLKKPRVKTHTCVCGLNFASVAWLIKHQERYIHGKNESGGVKEDVRTVVPFAVASDGSPVPPALIKHKSKEEHIKNTNPKENTRTVPFEHKHVLKLLRDKQYFCDVCHKRFTRVGPQALRNKHTNKQTTVKTVATAFPAASDSTVPLIKQEKLVEYVEVEVGIEENY